MKFKNIKNYITLIVLFAISLISIVLYGSVSELSGSEFIKSTSLAIFSTGLVMFMYEFIYSTRGDKYFEELIGEKLPFYLKMKTKGIENLSDSFEISKNKDIIINSKTMTVVMNDGKSFIGSNSYIFKHRFKQSNKETNFILLDPRSDFVNFLNQKNGKHDGDYYQRKILDVLKELLYDFEISEGHKVNIYIHSMFNTMAVIILDDIAMISLYRLSPGKSIVPHIEFKDVGGDCEFHEIHEDVEKLKKISDPVTLENYEKIKSDVFSKIKA